MPRDLNFAQLHEVIQAAFGWTDSHLHRFIIGGLIIGASEFDEDGLNDHRTLEATEIFLRDLVIDYLAPLRMLYEYDFGDGWRHVIEIERSPAPDTSASFPVCVDGARHACELLAI